MNSWMFTLLKKVKKRYSDASRYGAIDKIIQFITVFNPSILVLAGGNPVNRDTLIDALQTINIITDV